MEPNTVPTSHQAQSPVRLLTVENEDALRSMLSNFNVTRVRETENALRQLCELPGYDVALLDVDGLPRRETSAFDLLEKAQHRPIDSSFLIVSTHNDFRDQLYGLGLGADDYLAKPFEEEELRTRVEALLCRRFAPAAYGSYVYTLDDLSINFATHTCFRDGQRIPLTEIESSLLQYLVQHRGQTVSSEELRAALGDEHDLHSTRTIDHHVAAIREKIDPDLQILSYIKDANGTGYRFTYTECVPEPK